MPSECGSEALAVENLSADTSVQPLFWSMASQATVPFLSQKHMLEHNTGLVQIGVCKLRLSESPRARESSLGLSTNGWWLLLVTLSLSYLQQWPRCFSFRLSVEL